MFRVSLTGGRQSFSSSSSHCILGLLIVFSKAVLAELLIGPAEAAGESGREGRRGRRKSARRPVQLRAICQLAMVVLTECAVARILPLFILPGKDKRKHVLMKWKLNPGERLLWLHTLLAPLNPWA